MTRTLIRCASAMGLLVATACGERSDTPVTGLPLVSSTSTIPLSVFGMPVAGLDTAIAGHLAFGGMMGGAGGAAPAGYHGFTTPSNVQTAMSGGQFCGMGGGGMMSGSGAPRSGPTSDCIYSTASQRLVCLDVTYNGLTFSRSWAFTDVDGNAQQKPDSNTRTYNVLTKVIGSFTSAYGTIDVDQTSDYTMAGLGKASTSRTINSTVVGSEKRTGTASAGPATILRAYNDTTTDLKIPIYATLAEQRDAYPSAGRIARYMKITQQLGAQTPIVSTRSEITLFDGTDTAKITITWDAQTTNCTRQLPRGLLVCQ